MLVELAAALVDVFGAVVVDRLAGKRGDLARESLAIDTDQRSELVLARGDARFLEDGQPGIDARLDGIDEGAVEVEDARPRVRAALGRARSCSAR